MKYFTNEVLSLFFLGTANGFPVGVGRYSNVFKRTGWTGQQSEMAIIIKKKARVPMLRACHLAFDQFAMCHRCHHQLNVPTTKEKEIRKE